MEFTTEDEKSNMLSKLRREDNMYNGEQLAEIFRVSNFRTRNLDGSKVMNKNTVKVDE